MTLSHAYVGRISRIPPPPPPPLPPPTVDEELLAAVKAQSPSVVSVDGQEMVHHDFIQADEPGPSHSASGAAEDAARELEEAVLGSSVKTRGKGKQIKKRPAVGSVSGDSSDPDIPISQMGPAKKRRRVGRAAKAATAAAANAAAAEEMERSVTGDSTSTVVAMPAAVKTLVMSGRGRGKGKQREQSTESGSATPKNRKKGGPRKKLDTLPPQTQEILGIHSASASVSGDVTPVGSRPASPALTNVSATVYELDESIPPLKKAKKVDDASMLKRVKGLEEAQKKVWTNIARRDVVKVIDSCLLRKLYVLTMFRRSTDITLRATNQDKRNSSAWLQCVHSRLENLTFAPRRLPKMSKPKASVSCVRCWSSGRRTRRKREM